MTSSMQDLLVLVTSMDVIDTSLRSAGSREKLNPKNQGYDEEQVVIVSILLFIISNYW